MLSESRSSQLIKNTPRSKEGEKTGQRVRGKKGDLTERQRFREDARLRRKRRRREK